MSGLSSSIQIRSSYVRSVNLPRDVDNLELVQAYLPTAKALQALEALAKGLTQPRADRALALIGPYGSGKSAFALFVSALLAGSDSVLQQAALDVLRTHDPERRLLAHFRQPLGSKGYLRVVINGIPASLIQQVLNALLAACEKQHLPRNLIQRIKQALNDCSAIIRPTLDEVLDIIKAVQNAWAKTGGRGLLIEIDELGKFLEYEAYQAQQHEIHLLQLLAEYAQQIHSAPIYLLVMLHQTFEHYTQRLNKQLRNEWQKIQGRFQTLAFLEPAEQTLRLMANAFASSITLPATTQAELQQWMQVLEQEAILPYDLERNQAVALLTQCYPLHPITALLLPSLCQKVAQNERTLFSYLSQQEPCSFQQRLSQLRLGEWIRPSDLYDYFILNHPGNFADPLTYHRWIEVVTALERLEVPPTDTAIEVLKTIGLLNIIGNQRGLKASTALLQLLFPEQLESALKVLVAQSIIHFRAYNQEYKVWQGSDFDLHQHLHQAIQGLDGLSLADKLNSLMPFKPVVARRATIETGTLRSLPTYFVSAATLNNYQATLQPRLVFYLAENGEIPDSQHFGAYDVIATYFFTERLREAVLTQLALRDLPQHHAALHQDAVAQREHRDWLARADIETNRLLRTLLEQPETLHWQTQVSSWPVNNRRELQQHFSHWLMTHCYPKTPLLRNELINWDKPSASANTGRKRLINAMLNAAHQPYLGIEKTPAEMSLYLSLLKATDLHRQHQMQWGFHSPEGASFTRDEQGNVGIAHLGHDPCVLKPIWDAITQLLGDNGTRQIAVSEIYQTLRQPPFGLKLGILPVLLITYLLTYRREIAIYQEGIFHEKLNEAQAELLCRRPELFSLERFALKGLQNDLFDHYMSSIIGKVREDATLLDIVKPLVRFIAVLPPYSMHCQTLSHEAKQVREAFNQAQSPGILLFNALPIACGLNPDALAQEQSAAIETFIKRLVGALRELKGAYAQLLLHWQQQLARVLCSEVLDDLSQLRARIATRFAGLDQHTPDRMGLGAFIRRLVDTGYESDQAWLESVATLLGQKPPQKWTDENRLQAELALATLGQRLLDLEKLRLALTPKAQNVHQSALLLKMLDSQGTEISRVIPLSSTQRQLVEQRANEIALRLQNLDEAQQLAVIAALLGRLAPTPNQEEATYE